MATYVDMMESVADEVADWAINIIKDIIEVLAPDKRGFGEEPASEEDRLERYLELRGNAESWEQWIAERELTILQELVQSGMSEEYIAALDPRRITLAYALKYSAEMEKVLAKRLG